MSAENHHQTLTSSLSVSLFGSKHGHCFLKPNEKEGNRSTRRKTLQRAVRIWYFKLKYFPQLTWDGPNPPCIYVCVCAIYTHHTQLLLQKKTSVLRPPYLNTLTPIKHQSTCFPLCYTTISWWSFTYLLLRARFFTAKNSFYAASSDMCFRSPRLSCARSIPRMHAHALMRCNLFDSMHLHLTSNRGIMPIHYISMFEI